MTEEHSLRWHLDRDLPITLHEQIRGQITYAIVNGELGSGTPLPSIREMASMLKVSMMTVSNVYREMVSEGLIVSQPRVGYFVAPTSSIHRSIYSNNPQGNLRQIIQNCIRQALLLGYSIEEVRGVFSATSENYIPEANQNQTLG
jgi:GntR family transcriptional regulator